MPVKIKADVVLDLRMKELKDLTQAGARRGLRKIGAYTRREAKSSIRKRKKISDPGSPPSSHTGRLRKAIFYSVDNERLFVVIGVPPGKSAAPGLLEHGGTSERGTYKARPYLRPALKKICERCALKVFKGCVNKKS